MPHAGLPHARLLEDLDDRGLLDETLVVWMGEFGRSPRVNAKAGREHWPHVQSVILAGAGIARGAVYGASDRIGAYPADRPVRPADWDDFRHGLTALFWFELYTPDSTWAALTEACGRMKASRPRAFGFSGG